MAICDESRVLIAVQVGRGRIYFVFINCRCCFPENTSGDSNAVFYHGAAFTDALDELITIEKECPLLPTSSFKTLIVRYVW